MQTNNLTNDQQQRQDFVDNACYDLLVYLAKDKTVEWDIEHIGELRDTVQSILVDKLKLMTEMEFYPYVVNKWTSEEEDVIKNILKKVRRKNERK